MLPKIIGWYSQKIGSKSHIVLLEIVCFTTLTKQAGRQILGLWKPPWKSNARKSMKPKWRPWWEWWMGRYFPWCGWPIWTYRFAIFTHIHQLVNYKLVRNIYFSITSDGRHCSINFVIYSNLIGSYSKGNVQYEIIQTDLFNKLNCLLIIETIIFNGLSHDWWNICKYKNLYCLVACGDSPTGDCHIVFCFLLFFSVTVWVLGRGCVVFRVLYCDFLVLRVLFQSSTQVFGLRIEETALYIVTCWTSYISPSCLGKNLLIALGLFLARRCWLSWNFPVRLVGNISRCNGIIVLVIIWLEDLLNSFIIKYIFRRCHIFETLTKLCEMLSN